MPLNHVIRCSSQLQYGRRVCASGTSRQCSLQRLRLGLQRPSLPHQLVPGGRQTSVTVGAFWRRRRKSEPQEEATNSNIQQDTSQADTSDGFFQDHGRNGEDPVKDGVAFDAPESVEDVPLVLELAVQEGDTVDSLAKMFNMDAEKFIAANGGKRELLPGSKLRFQLPLPKDPAHLRQIMGVSAAEDQSERPAAVQNLLHVIERPHPIESTIRYLSPWVAVAGTALALFVWLARKTEASEREKLRQRAAVLRLQKQTERARASGLDHTDVPSESGHQPTAGHSEGSTVPGSQPAPGDRPSVMYERTQSGRAASTKELTQSEVVDGGPAADTSEEGPLQQAGRAEPHWLNLPQVHFIMLRGNQSLSFRLQPQLPNEFSWLAWEDKEEAVALLTWLMNQGSASNLVSPAIRTEQIKVASMRPIEFLRLADVNEKGASFMARGCVKIMASAAEEVLWADLLLAAKSLPRQPLCDGMASVQGVLQARQGKTQSAQPSLQQTQNAPAETAWQVHLPGETAAPAVQLLRNTGEPVIDVEASVSDSAGDLPVALAPAADKPAAAVPADAPQLPSAAAASHADSAVPGKPAERSNDQGDAAHGPAVSGFSGAEAHDSGGGGEQQGGRGGGDAADIEELAAALEDLRRIQDRAKGPQDYVPKMARQFAEEFGRLERGLMDTAAANPSMNAVEAAEKAEAAELEAMRSVVQNGADASPASNTSTEQDQAQASGMNWADFSVHSSRRYPQASSQASASSRAGDSTQAAPRGTQGSTIGSSQAGGQTVTQAETVAAPAQQGPPRSLQGALNPAHQATPATGKEPAERSLGASQLHAQELAADQGSRLPQADPEHRAGGNSSHARPQTLASASSPEPGKVAVEEGQLGAESRHDRGRTAGTVSAGGSEVEQAEERVQRARRAEEELQASFAASEAAQASSSGSASSLSSAPGAAPQKRRTDWWKQLPVIFMPCVTEAVGEDASFVQADISPDPTLEDPHVFGFVSKDDATCFSWLLQQSHHDSTCSIVPVTPAQLLAQGVGGEETGMTVFGRGQLRLPPTTPPDQLPELLAAHAQ